MAIYFCIIVVVGGVGWWSCTVNSDRARHGSSNFLRDPAGAFCSPGEEEDDEFFDIATMVNLQTIIPYSNRVLYLYSTTASHSLLI